MNAQKALQQYRAANLLKVKLVRVGSTHWKTSIPGEIGTGSITFKAEDQCDAKLHARYLLQIPPWRIIDWI